MLSYTLPSVHLVHMSTVRVFDYFELYGCGCMGACTVPPPPPRTAQDDDDATGAGGGPIAELKDLFRKKGAAALPQVCVFVCVLKGDYFDSTGGVLMTNGLGVAPVTFLFRVFSVEQVPSFADAPIGTINAYMHGRVLPPVLHR